MLRLHRNGRSVPVFLLLWTCVSSTVMPSTPAAPLFAFALLKALFSFLLSCIFSSSSGCALSRSFPIYRNDLRAPAYSSCSALSFCGQPSSARFSAIFSLSFFSRLYLGLCPLGPSPFGCYGLCWLLLVQSGLPVTVIPFGTFRADLPGYHTSLSLHLPAASATACSVQLLDFDLSGGLIPGDSLYTVSVRQARGLPPASFRFHLTVDILAFGCIFPAAGQIPDFHRLETCAAGRTCKKAAFRPGKDGKRLSSPRNRKPALSGWPDPPCRQWPYLARRYMASV